MKIKTFSLSLISFAVLSQSTFATDFVNYIGPNKNPIRTVEETLKNQERHKNKDKDLGKDHYRYPANSFYAVFYSSENIPTESIIRLWNFQNDNTPKKLNIENYHFTLDKSFPSSSLLELYSDTEAKYSNGKVTLGDSVTIPGFEDESDITVFDLEEGAKLAINDVNVEGLNLKTHLSVAELYKSKLDIDKAAVSLSGDNNKFTFDLESSIVNINKLNMKIVGNGRFNIGFLTANSDLTVKNSQLSIDSHNKNASVLFSSNDSDVNIINSQLIAKNKAILFANAEDDYDAQLSREQNTFNIRNTSALSDDVLIMLHKEPLLPKEDEDENTFITSKRFVFNVENSKLSGRTVQLDEPIPLVLNLSKNTEWKVTGNSEVTELNNQDSTVSFEQGGFHILKLDELKGSGQFSLRTDLANQISDQIQVKNKAEGKHLLVIRDSGNEPTAPNGKVTLVKTSGKGDVSFSLKDKDYVDAGAYRYRLAKENNDWILSNKDESTKPVEPKPVLPPTPVQTAQLALSETTNALVSLRQAQLVQLEQSLASIHQRLSELKQGEKGNVWIRNINSRHEFDATATANNSRSSGFKQNIHIFQIGADWALTDHMQLGGFVGLTRSNVDFNGEYGEAKLSGKTAGIYATYLADNEVYFDQQFSFSRLNTNSTERRHYNGYTLTSEIGKKWQFSDWQVTPSAKLAWHHLSGSSNEQVLNAFSAKIGAKVAKTIRFNGWQIQPYLALNVLATKQNDSQIRVNQYQFNVAKIGSQIESLAGVKVGVGQHQFALELTHKNGKSSKQPLTAKAVYRYQW